MAGLGSSGFGRGAGMVEEWKRANRLLAKQISEADAAISTAPYSPARLVLFRFLIDRTSGGLSSMTIRLAGEGRADQAGRNKSATKLKAGCSKAMRWVRA